VKELGYKDIFDARGKSYNMAARICPSARETERQILIDLLAPAPGERIIDAPAGGGYVADALQEAGCLPLCVEPSEAFASALPDNYETIIAPVSCLPFENDSADKYGSLTGLHHLSSGELAQFFSEAWRVLKSGSVIAVADVLAGSDVDRFLNGPVDRYTNTGHNGHFFNKGDFSRHLEAAGFRVGSEQYHEYIWSFPDEKVMTTYMKTIFGLDRADLDTVHTLVNDYLQVVSDSTGVHVKWGLLYASGVK